MNDEELSDLLEESFSNLLKCIAQIKDPAKRTQALGTFTILTRLVRDAIE